MLLHKICRVANWVKAKTLDMVCNATDWFCSNSGKMVGAAVLSIGALSYAVTQDARPFFWILAAALAVAAVFFSQQPDVVANGASAAPGKTKCVACRAIIDNPFMHGVMSTRSLPAYHTCDTATCQCGRSTVGVAPDLPTSVNLQPAFENGSPRRPVSKIEEYRNNRGAEPASHDNLFAYLQSSRRRNMPGNRSEMEPNTSSQRPTAPGHVMY